MMFGVFMSLRNYRYFNDKISIICQFIPQIIFLVFLFFYLTLLMFIKWVTYSAQNEVPWGVNCAPSILITFINMVLFKSVDYDSSDPLACSPYMFSGQGALQRILVLLAVACIPWMLFAKPFYIMRSRKEASVSIKANIVVRNGTLIEIHILQHQPIDHPVENGDAEAGLNNGQLQPRPEGGHDEEEMSEIFIHQGIHTIEYVLGSVSHTASYLRLWALSLAHARKYFLNPKLVFESNINQSFYPNYRVS